MRDDPREEKLIQLTSQLRAEAESVKDCFTRFSFQALALSVLVLGVIAKFQSANPHVAFASVLVIVLVLAVARIGTYKYGTANRHFGYQLHLERTSTFINQGQGAWQPWMRYVGWEEAMRAWRVIQATVFEELYETGLLRANRLTQRAKSMDYKWFVPSALVEGASHEGQKASYYAGSYLRYMHALLHIVALLSLVPLLVALVQYRSDPDFQPYSAYFLSATFVVALAVVTIFFRIWKDTYRRKSLEDGLLSIHSCAIMWQAIIIAHYRALSNALKSSNSHKGYTRYLSEEAVFLARALGDIHEWILAPLDSRSPSDEFAEPSR